MSDFNKKVSVVIMACRQREKYFEYLKEKLGDIPFSIDEVKGQDGHVGVWENCKRAWRMRRDSEWTLILQDDSIICEHFYERVEKVLEEIGERDYIISFYAGDRLKKKIEFAQKKKLDYVLYNSIMNENALCMRTKHIEEMIRYCDTRDATTDRFIQTFARRKGLLIYYTIPSLIDHRSDKSIYRDVFEKPLPDSIRHAVIFADKKNYDY